MTPGGLLLMGALSAVAGIAFARSRPRVWLAVTLVGALSALGAAGAVLCGAGTWEWRPGFIIGGEPIHLRLDGLSAYFLALVALIAGASGTYSCGYWPDTSHPRSSSLGRAGCTCLFASMSLVLLAGNGLHFLIVWELFSVCGFFLIILDRRRRQVREAGWLYLVASHAGTLFLLAFFALLASRTGSWDLGPWRQKPELGSLFWLALIGFGLKAGIFPLHIWLPSAHAQAPSHISAIFSGAAIKMGIYGLVRFSGWLPVGEPVGWMMAALGVLSAVLGIVFALAQNDLKRLLAFCSVENVGIIVMGLGFGLIGTARNNPLWGQLAFVGALLHVWNHGVFKSLLFFGAGSVLHACGTGEMSRLGGLWKAMPWTAGCFGLGAAAISSLPPLNGFVSEWLMFLGLFGAISAKNAVAGGAVAAAILLSLTGALSLACFVKVCGIVFLGSPRSDAAFRAQEVPGSMRAPMLMLSGICVVLGAVPGFFWPALARASMDWKGEGARMEMPAALGTLGAFQAAFALLAATAAVLLWRKVRQNGVSRAGTWGCGYSVPSPRMQYTSGSFAAIITGWFDWALQPKRHAAPPQGWFPAKAELVIRPSDTVLDKVIAPASRRILTFSMGVRRLQRGRLQSYILYLIGGLAALAIVVVWRSGS